jgi:hypothetical protein
MGYSFLQDDKGNYSHTRLCTMAVFVTFCVAYLAVTGSNVIRGVATMADIPMGVVTVIGLMWAGSDIRKAIENKGPQPPLTGG